jgi:hypothetical protein
MSTFTSTHSHFHFHNVYSDTNTLIGLVMSSLVILFIEKYNIIYKTSLVFYPLVKFQFNLLAIVLQILASCHHHPLSLTKT